MAKINKLAILKGAAELVASAGTGIVVGNLVKATTPYDLNRLQRVLVGVGSYTLGGVLSDLSAKYIASQIQTYADKLDEILHPVVPVEADPDDVVVFEESKTVDGIPAKDFGKPENHRGNFVEPDSEENDEN